jgi:hypothetical protein
VLDAYKNGTKEDRVKIAKEHPRIGRLWHVIRKSLPKSDKKPKPISKKAIAERIRERLRIGFKHPITRPFFISLRKVFFFEDVAERYLRSRK